MMPRPEGERSQVRPGRVRLSLCVSFLLLRGLAHRLGDVQALLPQAPNRANQVAFERPYRFAPRFPFRLASRQIRVCLRHTVRLTSGNAVQDCIQAPMPATVQAVPHQPGG